MDTTTWGNPDGTPLPMLGPTPAEKQARKDKLLAVMVGENPPAAAVQLATNRWPNYDTDPDHGRAFSVFVQGYKAALPAAATSVSGGAGADTLKAIDSVLAWWGEDDFITQSDQESAVEELRQLRAALAASPASVSSPQEADFGRFSNDLGKRLPDAFTNAIGVLEHLGREGVAEHLQRVAKIWQRDLKARAAEPAELKQELGNLYATIFRDGGHMQAALDADTPHDVPTLDRPRYVEAIKAYWKLRQQAESPAALDINKAADWLLDHGRILFDNVHDGEDAKKVAAFAFAEALIENCAAAARSLGVAEPGGWISVDERLPEYGDEVWVAVAEEHQWFFGKVAHGIWLSFGVNRSYHDKPVPPDQITHWMPRHEPKHPSDAD